MKFRKFALALSLAALPQLASAATCPADFPGSKPIRLVVGFGAGGGTDVAARAWATGFEKLHKWTVVVENRPGASGGVLMTWLKGQPADGYILGATVTDSVTINPAQADVGYTWDDFSYLGTGMQNWFGLVALKDKPYNNLKDLIAYAKEKGRATISVAGVNQEILIAQLSEEFKVNLVAVPGTGAAEAMKELLGGHVDASTQGVLHVAQIKADKLKQLASLITRRVPYAPESGTLAEQGSSAAPVNSYAQLVAPKALPVAIKTCLKEALDEVVKSDDYKALMDKFDNAPLNVGEDGAVGLVSRGAAFYKDAVAKLNAAAKK
jgi:tripartite-type tricarboxylate transporter receptor subunit TctC